MSKQTVHDRVIDRVALAEADLTQHRAAPARRRNPALWHVFRDLGQLHRDNRRETGAPPSPVVRDAAYAFQKTPSLSTLTAVAELLDEQGLKV